MKRKKENANALQESKSPPPAKKTKHNSFAFGPVKGIDVKPVVNNLSTIKNKPESISYEQVKYNKFLPENIKKHVLNEIVEWKKELLAGFRKFQTTKNWETLEMSIELLGRYFEVDYPLSMQERGEICSIMCNAILDPQIDLGLQTLVCLSLNGFIKKKDKFDFTVPWRPFYEMLDKIYFAKYRVATYTPRDHGNAIVGLIKKLKRYFPKSATNEILEEFRPIMCFHDHLLFKAQGFLCLFLPTNTGTIEWLDEIMTYWSGIGMYPTYDQGFISLLASAAEDCAGNINWEPYLPLIFTKILICLDVPIGNSPPNIYDEYPIEECQVFGSFEYAKTMLMASCAKLIVWLLSPGSKASLYLKKLLKSVESYYHPSNDGSWTTHLSDFLLVLCARFAKRLQKERSKDTAELVPQKYRLQESQCNEFVEMVLPIAITAMYSKSQQMTICANHALKHLCYIGPEIVFPPLLESCFHALQTLTATHQTVSALETLSVIIFPMLKKSHYANGRKYLADLMTLTLPGIDTNDMRKTWSTLKFYTALLVCLPLIETTPTKGKRKNSSEKVPSVVHIYEDWCIQLLDRTFIVLSNQGPPKKDQTIDGIHPSIFWGMFDLFFNQLSEELHNRCAKKLFNFVTSEFLINAKKNVGHICASASYANPKTTLAIFVPMLYNNLIDSKGNLTDLTDTEREWYLHILGQVVYRTGKELLPYKDQLWKILKLTWNSKEKKIVKCAGKLIRNILRSLTFYYPKDIRSVNPDIWKSKEFLSEHWKTWGEFLDVDNLKIDWHTPSKEEIDVAVEFVNYFLDLPVMKVREFIKEIENQKKPTPERRNEIKNHLLFIRYILRGSSSLFPEITTGIIEEFTKYDCPTRGISCGIGLADEKALKYNYLDLGQLCHELCQILLKNKSDEPSILSTLARVIYPIFCVRGGFARASYKKKRSSYRYIKAHNFKTYRTSGGKYPRYMQGNVSLKITEIEKVKRTQLSLEARTVIANDSIPYTEIHRTLLHDLLDLSLSLYSAVRKKAQSVFTYCIKRFPEEVSKPFIPKVLQALCNKDSTDGQRTGAIYILERPSIMKIITYDWELLSKLMIAMCNTSHIEKHTIQDRIQVLFDMYFLAFYQIKLDEKTIDIYNNAIKEMLDLVEKNPNWHWKYQHMVESFIVLMIRSDGHLLPIRAIKWLFTLLKSDIEKLRQLAQEGITLILCQYKRKQPRKMISTKGKTMIDDWEHIKDPKNEEEWKNTYFFEKNYYGWNVCPTKTWVYIYNEEEIKLAQPKDPIEKERQELIKELKSILTPEYLKQFFHYLAIRDDPFSETIVQMFKGLFQILGEEFFIRSKPHFEELLKHAGSGKQEEIFYMSSCAEWVTGLIRGMKHWSYSQHLKIYEYLIPVLSDVLDKCSLNCVEEWCECIEFSVCDKDPRRCKWIRDLLIEKFEKYVGTESSTQQRYLKYMYSYINAVYWRDPKTSEHILSILSKHLSHPYEQVRENISLFISGILKALWKPPRDPNTNIITSKGEEKPVKCLDDFLNFVSKEFKKVEQQKSTLKTDVKQEADSTVKALCKTTISWIFGLFSSHVPHYGLKYSTDIISFLNTVQDFPDEELNNLVKADYYFIACFPFNNEITRKILIYINKCIAEESNWRLRESLLEFLQIFGFRQQFYLQEKEYQDVLFNTISERLKDPQLEVSELACDTVAGFIKISEKTTILQLAELFKKWAKTPVKKKKKTEADDKNIMLRNAGILGIAAITKAFPIDVPDFLPPLLTMLARYSTYGPPVGTIVKKVFAEFWKSHSDGWHQIHKKKFDEDQLFELQQTQSSTLYYV